MPLYLRGLSIIHNKRGIDMSKSVFAIFRAEVRVIDSAKRNALHRRLIESVLATAPGERLDEKLAAVSLMEESVDCMC